MVINSFFTRNGNVATGLSPLVFIWQMVGTVRTIVINGATAVETGNGFYAYDFVAYDKDLDYTVMVDAGAPMTVYGRYNIATITPTAEVVLQQSDIDQIAAGVVDGVWDADRMAHNISGSTGEALNQIKADTTSISLAIVTIDQLLRTLTKYETNRTKIDTVAKTLTVYDDDKVTPIRVFDLKDTLGNASVAEVAERNPR